MLRTVLGMGWRQYLFLSRLLFLGEFAKSRKATISFVMSVCPSVRPSARIQQLGYH